MAEIVTERLVLRPMQGMDFPRFAEIWADPAVAAAIGIAPRSDADSRAAFLAIAGHWALDGYGQWAICDRESGQMLGQTGFFNAMRGHTPEFDAFPEAGWVLAREVWGKGLGREAVAAAHGWLDSTRPGVTVAQSVPGNAASLRLATRMGYRRFGMGRSGDRGVVLLKRGD